MVSFMKILADFKYVLLGFYLFNYFKTSIAIQAKSQLCAYKYCLRFGNCKVLKTLLLCIHVNCILLAFSDHGTSKISQNLQFSLVSEHEFLYTEVDYALLLMFEILRNVKESVHGTQTILIHV